MIKKIKSLFNWLLQDKKRLVIILVIVLIGFFAVRKLTKKSTTTASVQTAKVEKGMIVSSVSASGSVLSVNVMSANTKASGIVKKVYVKDGDKVKKGDKILEIALDFQGEQKNVSAWSSYLSAKNSLESAQASLYTSDSAMWAANRKFINDAVARNLLSTDPTYIQENDDWKAAEMKYLNQKAAITQAQTAITSNWLNYKLTSPTITAPTDGIVTSLMYIEGMNIGSLDTGSSESNQKVATIKTEGTPIISVNLSEIDVSRVALGKKVTITFDSISDKTFTGKVVGVDRIGSTTSNVTQYPAIIQLDSSSDLILPNMTATANIIIDQKENVLLVPSSAVSGQGEESFVRIRVNGKEQPATVQTGLTSDTQTEIISGLSEGDEVIISNLSQTNSQSNGGSPFGSFGAGGMIRAIH